MSGRGGVRLGSRRGSRGWRGGALAAGAAERALGGGPPPRGARPRVSPGVQRAGAAGAANGGRRLGGARR